MKESFHPESRISRPYPPAKDPPKDFVTGGVRVGSYRNLRVIECEDSSFEEILRWEHKRAFEEGIHALGIIGAIVVGQQILLLRRALHDTFLPGHYELPSGGVENNEDILPALLREIQEETGMITPSHTELLASFDISYNERMTRHFAFLVLHSSSVVTIDPNEHMGYAWCPIKDTETLQQHGLDQDAEPWIIEEAKRRLSKLTR